MFLFGGKWVGLELASTGLRVVKLQVSGKRFRLVGARFVPFESVESSPSEATSPRRAATLGELFERARDLIVGSRAVLSLAKRDFLHRVVEFPLSDPNEIRESMRWEFSRHFPLSYEEVYFDLHVTSLKGESGNSLVSIVCARRALVEFVLELVPRGTKVVAVEPPFCSLIRFLEAAGVEMPSGFAILDVGNSLSGFYVCLEDAVLISRTFSWGGTHLASQVASHEGQAEVVPEGLASSSLVSEVVNTIRFAEISFRGLKVDRLFLVGGGSELPGLHDAFSSRLSELNCKVEIPSLKLDGAEGIKGLPHSPGSWCAPLGAALRGVFPS